MAITADGLRKFLASHFFIAEEHLGDDAPLLSQGLIDSFGLVEMLTFLEKEEGIRIGARETTLENLDTINRIITFLDSRTTGR